MIKWLIKIATSPVQFIEELYPDRELWDINLYFLRMYYHELELSRPKMWDRIWQRLEAEKAQGIASGESGAMLLFQQRKAFAQELNYEISQIALNNKDSVKDGTGGYVDISKLWVDPKIVEKNWNRLSNTYADPAVALVNINKIKFDNFTSWIKELENAEYDPTFLYIVSQQLIKKFGKDKIMPPPEVDAEVLAKVSELMSTGAAIQDDGNPIKFWDLWQSASLSIQASDFETSGWIKFAKGSDPKRLKNCIQGSGWCIAGNQYAEQYLASGDVHIFFHGKAQVAMHVTRSHAVEVFERFNHPVTSYAGEVIQYCQDNDITLDKSTNGYESLRRAMNINEAITHYPGYAKDFALKIEEDPDNYLLLRREHRKNPEYKQAYLTAVMQNLKSVNYGSSIAHILDRIDADIVATNKDFFISGLKEIILQTNYWNDLFQLLQSDHKLLKLAVSSPEVTSHAKSIYITKKQTEIYNTTGQGNYDKGDIVGSWLSSDPQFLKQICDIIIYRINNASIDETMFMLSENNELILRHSDVDKTLRAKIVHYLTNNPDDCIRVRDRLSHLSIIDMGEQLFYDIQNNIDNWLRLLSPTHPRNKGYDYKSVGMKVEYETNDSSRSEYGRKEDIHKLTMRAYPPKLLTHPNWPLETQLGLTQALDYMPPNVAKDDRIVDSIVNLVSPIWQKSLDTVLQPSHVGQPANFYDSGNNRDVHKSWQRYCEMGTLDDMDFTKHPELQKIITQHFYNPQFLAAIVDKSQAHVHDRRQFSAGRGKDDLQGVINELSLKNVPVPNDPVVHEAIQTFRKESAKAFIKKLYPSDLETSGGDATGLNIIELMQQHKMDIPAAQFANARYRHNGWSALSEDLQNDPEIQRYYTSMLKGTIQNRMQSDLMGRYRSTRLRSLQVIPPHMWEQPEFKPHEKEMWVRALEDGDLQDYRSTIKGNYTTWYPNVVTAIWKSVPDYLKSDPEIRGAMETAINRVVPTTGYGKNLMTIADIVSSACDKHRQLVPLGSDYTHPGWLNSPFRAQGSWRIGELSPGHIQDFSECVRAADAMYTALQGLGYESEYLQKLVGYCETSLQKWFAIKDELDTLFAKEDQSTQQLINKYPGFRGRQATSWLSRTVESYVVRKLQPLAATH